MQQDSAEKEDNGFDVMFSIFIWMDSKRCMLNTYNHSTDEKIYTKKYNARLFEN